MSLEINEVRRPEERLILLRCAVPPYHRLLIRASAQGLAFWCKECKCQHRLSWSHLQALQADLNDL